MLVIAAFGVGYYFRELKFQEISGISDKSAIVINQKENNKKLNCQFITNNAEITKKDETILRLQNEIDGLKNSTTSKLDYGVLAMSVANLFTSLMDDEQITSLIANNSTFSKKEISEMEDPIKFASKLAQINAGLNLVHSDSDLKYEKFSMRFSNQKDVGSGLSQDMYPSSEGKIYSNFKLIGYSGKEVMVKWHNLSTLKTHIFKSYPINTDSDNNYIWLDMGNNWEEGEYSVEIYSKDESLNLLTEGKYGIYSLN